MIAPVCIDIEQVRVVVGHLEERLILLEEVDLWAKRAKVDSAALAACRASADAQEQRADLLGSALRIADSTRLANAAVATRPQRWPASAYQVTATLSAVLVLLLLLN